MRVTDRGPHTKGRIIDLSYGAASKLGMLSQGIAMVEIERVEKTRVPYRDTEEIGMPEFEFDFSKLSVTAKPSMPIRPTKPNVPIRPTMHNMPTKHTTTNETRNSHH